MPLFIYFLKIVFSAVLHMSLQACAFLYEHAHTHTYSVSNDILEECGHVCVYCIWVCVYMTNSNVWNGSSGDGRRYVYKRMFAYACLYIDWCVSV